MRHGRDPRSETHDPEAPALAGDQPLGARHRRHGRHVRFYHGVLGARLVRPSGTPQFRHYFFEFGAQNTVAFFEYAGVPVGPVRKARRRP